MPDALTTHATEEIGLRPRPDAAVGHWDRWLDPAVNDPDELRGMMAPPTGMRIDPASTADNSGPQLLDPIPAS